MRILLLTLLPLTIMASETPSYGHKDFYPSPDQPVGFRGDGNGAFPGATPVVHWREGKVIREKDVITWDGRQKKFVKRHGVRIDTSTDRLNIPWKTEMPGFGCGGVIVVGDRVITTAEPHFLVCCDIDSGSIRWTLNCSPWRLRGLPEAEAEKLEQIERALMALYVSAYRHVGNYTRMPTEFSEAARTQWARMLDDSLAIADKIATLTTDYDIDALKTELLGIKETIAKAKVLAPGEKYPKHQNPGKLVAGPWVKACFNQAKRFADTHGFPIFFGWYGYVGWTFATPISDGQHIYISMGQGQVACVDLDGNIVWKHQQKLISNESKKARNRGTLLNPKVRHCASPVLADGILVVQSTNKAIAYTAATGKVLWENKQVRANGYDPCTPKIFTVQIKGKDQKVYVERQGRILDLMTGQQLGKMPYNMGGEGGRPSIVGQGSLVVAGGGKPYGGLQLQGQDDGLVTHQWLPDLQMKVGGATPVFHNGRIYDIRGKRILDVQTGQALSTTKTKGKIVQGAGIGSVLVGNYLISIAKDNKPYRRARQDMLTHASCYVMDVSDGSMKPVATNYLGGLNKPRSPAHEEFMADDYEAGGFNAITIPAQFSTHPVFAQGNRMFLRSTSHLYCIGDPNIPYNGKRKP